MNKKPLPIPDLVLVTDVLSDNQENFTSEENALRAMQITRWGLKLLGIWPLSPKSSYREKFFKYIVIAVCSSLLLFILIPGILFICIIADDSSVAVKLCGALSFCSMAIMEYCTLLLRRQDIANCIQHLISDWKQTTSAEDRSIMKTYAKFGRWGTMICSIFMYSGGAFYSGILPCVSPNTIDENNATIRRIAYPSYYGAIDPQGDVAYVVIFITHCCCAFIMHSVSSVSCNVAVVFALHACGQLKILTRPLRNSINDTSTSPRLDKILPYIVQHHIRTLKFIGDLEKILNKICLVEMVGRSISICMLEYYFLLEWQDSDAIGLTTYTILIISESFNIFLFCYIGDLVAQECRNVGDSTYMIDWYKLSTKNSRQITLLMLAAQNPVTITGGKIINLSLVTFVTVLRTSIVYFNLLREVTE